MDILIKKNTEKVLLVVFLAIFTKRSLELVVKKAIFFKGNYFRSKGALL
jgi:hypothetical protein